MSRILVVGSAPYWAVAGGVKATAKNQRVWQLIQPLLADGHEIDLCAEAPDGIRGVRLPDGLRIHTFDIRRLGWRNEVQRLCQRAKPAVIVATMWRGAVLSLCLPKAIPLWADIYGYSAAEVQLMLNRNRSDRGLLATMALSRRVLRRVDAISACSHRHADALVGELGMVGRLNRHTVGYQFVHSIAPSVAAPPPLDPEAGSSSRGDGGSRSANSEVRLLFYGGYNAWTDTSTLLKGVSIAMERCPNLVFVSVGGGVDGVDTASYTGLLERIASSPFRDRFRMLGWLSSQQARDVLVSADIGISVDSWHYETLFGTRTRLVDMMANGVPVITTLGCELSETIRDRMAGLVCPIGDAGALADTVTRLYHDVGLRRQLLSNASELLRGELSPAATTVALRQWVKSPALAPDRMPGAWPTLFKRLDLAARAQARLMVWDTLGRLASS